MRIKSELHGKQHIACESQGYVCERKFSKHHEKRFNANWIFHNVNKEIFFSVAMLHNVELNKSFVSQKFFRIFFVFAGIENDKRTHLTEFYIH